MMHEKEQNDGRKKLSFVDFTQIAFYFSKAHYCLGHFLALLMCTAD